MSLQLWLPFNGNFTNYGLAPGITIVNNENRVIFANEGRINTKSAYFDTSYGKKTYLKTNYAPNIGTGNFSIAFWIKISSDLVNYDTNFPHIVSTKNANAANLGFAVIYQKSDNTIGLRICNGSTNNNPWAKIANIDFSNYFNLWMHIILIRDNNRTKNGCAFVNGILYDYDSSVSALDAGNKIVYIGDVASDSGYYPPLPMYLSDLRIYDHALSDKEAKELAKGLILHYKLTNTFLLINANLLQDTNVSSLTKVNAAYNRYYESASSGNYTATWITITDPPIYGINYGVKYKVTTPGSYFHSVTWYKDSTIPIKSGEIYTMSCYVKRLSGTDLNFRFLYGKSPYYHLDLTLENDDIWHLYSWTFTCELANTRIYCGGLNAAGEVIVCGWKLEKGDTATPWCEYNFLQNATTEIKDVSGYNHDGTIIGSPIAQYDSKRYNNCIHFELGQYIKTNEIVSTFMPVEELSVNAWINYSTSGAILSCTLSGGFNFYPTLFSVYIGSSLKKVTITAVPSNEWHMLTGVFNGLTAIFYIDKELVGYTAAAGIIKYVNNRLIISGEANGSSGVENSNFVGDISDVRIYATALSNEDIKELYETSVSIDNKSNIYSRQFEENNLNKISITNRGQLQMDAIEEDSSTASFYKDTKDVKGLLIYEY